MIHAFKEITTVLVSRDVILLPTIAICGFILVRFVDQFLRDTGRRQSLRKLAKHRKPRVKTTRHKPA